MDEGKETHPLHKVSLRVLEDWAMMLVDEIKFEETTFDPALPLYMSWVNIEGHITGALSIVAQENFLKTLAINLLGEAEGAGEPGLEYYKDAFKEMGNVLAGNFFTEAYSDEVVFNIIDPNVTEVPFAELEKIKQRRIRYCYLADGAPVVITFSLKK